MQVLCGFSAPSFLVHFQQHQVCYGDGLHAVSVQVVIAVVACCVKHRSGQAC